MMNDEKNTSGTRSDIFLKLKILIIWIINSAMIVYLIILGIIFLSKGSGFDFNILFFHIKIHEPANPILILLCLIILRICISIEIKNTVTLLISIIFSISLLELSLRILDFPIAKQPTLKKWRQPSMSLGWELIPLTKGKGHVGANVEINSHGLRDIERTWNKKQDEYRILAIGDSFTFGYGVELYETYLKKLESLISDKGIKADVINGGVIGYNLFQCLNYVKQKGIKYNPDAVLYFFYIDDVGGVANSEKEIEEFYQSFSKSEENEQKLHRFSHSYIVNFAKNGYTFLWNKFRFLTDAEWIRSINKRKQYFSKECQDFLIGKFNRELFSKNLIELNMLTQEAGTAFLVILIPDAVQIHNPHWQKINQIVSEICNTHHISFLDMTPVFEKESDIVSLYLFPIDAHTSSKGNTIIANNVYKKIQELGWLLPR